MAIEIIGQEYTDDQGRTLNFPLFDGVDSMTATYDFTVDISMSVDLTNAVQLDNNKLTLTNGIWDQLGFKEGSAITGELERDNNGTTETINFTGKNITFINGAEMFLDAGYISAASGAYTTGHITCIATCDAVDFYFNLVPNDASGYSSSLNDGEETKFQADISGGLSVGASVAFNQIGNKSGGSSMFPTLTRLADVNGLKTYRIFTQFKNYLIAQSHEEYFELGACVKPWIKISGLIDFQNPSVKLSLQYAPSDGNTGYFDEVYNGGIPDYDIEFCQFKDADGDVVPTIDYSASTDFVIRVNGIFTSDSKLNIAFFWDPKNSIFFKNNSASFEFNHALATSDAALTIGTNPDITGNLTMGGAGINIIAISVAQFGTYADIQGTIIPNTEFNDLIASLPSDPTLATSDRLYRLSVKVQDPTLTDNFIRAVWLTASQQELAKNIKPLGPYENVDLLQMVDHINNVDNAPITEDDVKIEGNFRLPKFDRSFTGLSLRIDAYKNTGESFNLEEFDINFSQWPELPDGSVPVDFSTPRGFLLPPSSDKNQVSVYRNELVDDTNYYGLIFEMGSLMNWRYWLSQLNASLDFYSTQNQNWQHYQIGGWGVRFVLETQTINGSYENHFNFSIAPYGWPYQSEITYEKLDGTSISAPILGEIIKIIATHTITSVWQPYPWGQITVEPTENNPRWLISTFLPWDNDVSNPLSPLNGEAQLKVSLPSPGIAKFECLFDASKIDVTNGIKFTSRVDGYGSKDVRFRTRYQKNETVAVKPNIFVEENRGWDDCCDPIIVVASSISLDRYKNDPTSAWDKGDYVTFSLKDHEGNNTPYQPDSIPFLAQSNAFYCTVEWRDVLLSSGIGCYNLYVNVTYAGIEASYLWGEYILGEYEMYAPRTVRVLSVFNDMNDYYGINFTGSNVVDSIRFIGRFGYFDPNTHVDNIKYADSTNTKIRREELTTYELHADLAGWKIVNKLRLHFVAENQCWISDHNPDNFEYYLDKSVIFDEAIQPVHNPGTRKITIGAKYKDKISRSRTHFFDNDPPAHDITPPDIQSQFAQVENSDGTFTAGFSTSSPFILPDSIVSIYENGTLVDSFTFPTLEPGTTINIEL